LKSSTSSNGNAGIQHISTAGTYAGTLDASKFVGATQVWQDTNAADVSQLADGVTAGLRNWLRVFTRLKPPMPPPPPRSR
jgi:hypothetical protein